MKLMPVQPKHLRADATGPAIGVDRADRRINGYVVAQEGRFKSRGRGEFDAKSLKAIVKLMKANRAGTKSHFTHPTLSDDGLGKFLGRAQDPRLDTVEVDRDGAIVQLQAVRADLYLSPTAFEGNPNGNLGEYVLSLADSDPDALSSSLVLDVLEEYRLNKDGTVQRDEETGEPLPPLWRPLKIFATDLVDTGDAVDGLLSAQLSPELLDGLPDGAVRSGAALLDRVFRGQPRDVVAARCQAWLDRYLSLRSDGCDRQDPDPAAPPVAPAVASAAALRRRRLLLV